MQPRKPVPERAVHTVRNSDQKALDEYECLANLPAHRHASGGPKEKRMLQARNPEELGGMRGLAFRTHDELSRGLHPEPAEQLDSETEVAELDTPDNERSGAFWLTNDDAKRGFDDEDEEEDDKADDDDLDDDDEEVATDDDAEEGLDEDDDDDLDEPEIDDDDDDE